MTLSDIRDFSRRLSRIKVTQASDDIVDRYINVGMKAMATAIGGFYSERYIAVRPTFDLSPIMAVDISIDAAEAITVTLCDNDVHNLTGSQAAAIIQTKLLEELTGETVAVTFSETAWAFSVAITGATSISIDTPGSDIYLDGTKFIFGTSGSQTAATWVGETPEYSTAELAMPSDYVDVLYITWEGSALQKTPYQAIRDRTHGTPAYYATVYDAIKLYPIPEKQGICYMAYMAIPPTISGDTDVPDIPESAHLSLAHYAASKLSEEAFDSERASRYYNQFMVEVNRLRAEIANMNSETFMLKGQDDFRAFRRNYQL